MVGSKKFGPQVVCNRTLPKISAAFQEAPVTTSSRIISLLEKVGVRKLYSHQVESLQHTAAGKDLIVSTPTASGKSLIYNVPVIQSLLDDQNARSLYLFPLKALAQDQLKTVSNLLGKLTDVTDKKVRQAAVYDGDTSAYQRSKIRKDPPAILITNPEMLHLSILPFHESWIDLFKNLRHLVIDEVHVYRGVFGSHMAWVIRRLLRVAHHYGADPRITMLSATIGNPKILAEKLTGRESVVVAESGAPVSAKHVLFLNPWDNPAYAASQLLEAAVKRDLRTIVYTKSRRMTELISMWTSPKLGPMKDKVSAYRAGFLPEERREIERDLSRGNLIGVISTSALELGIDIGDLDLCILVGYPGSIMSTWQRGGRVGRAQRDSAIILLAGEDALDQYYMNNPDDFFSRSPEHAALNPFNSKIMQQHLHCAAAELPISSAEPFAQNTQVAEELNDLTEHAVLYQDRNQTRWIASRKRPHRDVHLRGDGSRLAVINKESGEIIGEIDGGRALKETHDGAVYIHRSKTLVVIKLDLEGREVIVDEQNISYYTRPTVVKHTEILNEVNRYLIGDTEVCYGQLRVTERVTGYHKINQRTGKIISKQQLDLPEEIIETEGVWFNIHETHRKNMVERKAHFMGAIHAMEHMMIALFPLLVLCDRNDIGGISCPEHEQTNGSSIFIYDGYHGGAGLCLEVFPRSEELLRRSLATIQGCECENGCPSCVHSPKCGSGNRPIDKDAAAELFSKLVNASPDKHSTTRRSPVINALNRPASKSKKENEDYPKKLAALPERYTVFDLETKRGASEVGGWGRADKMGVSVAVAYDSTLDDYITFLDEEMNEFVSYLQKQEIVIGFNIERFDYQVLSAYTDFALHTLPTFDILTEIKKRLGYRLSLDRIAEHTLGEKKSADGLQALRWYKEGKLKELVRYCRKDVEITRDILLHGLEKGHLLFRNKARDLVRLPCSFDERIYDIISDR